MTKRNKVIASALILALAAGSAVMTLRSRDLEQRLRKSEDNRAARCESARYRALSAVHGDIRMGRLAKQRGIEHVTAASGGALGVYLHACSDDKATRDMASVFSNLVFSLVMAGQIDALEALEKKLADTPLEEWKTLTLPDQPSLWMELAGGDRDEAGELERRANEAANALDTNPE